jgi:obg-like ATPase 1
MHTFEEKILLGCPSNNLKIGIVGVFLLMTLHSPKDSLLSIDSSFLDLGKAANFPYATIDPEAGHVIRHPFPPLKSIP